MMPQQRRRRRRAALPRAAERRVVVSRGPGGFGFTIAGQRPCVVSAVAAGGPAERAGLRAGDALLAVDGASVARAPHAAVVRLVAGAPGAIALGVAPRAPPPTDTEDTEPDERARTRRRHPPPRRRPLPTHPPDGGCPSTSGMSEILHNLSRAQLSPHQEARLECRVAVGYLGTIETPQASPLGAPSGVRAAVKKLRQERRGAAPVLLSVLPGALLLRRAGGQLLAQYRRERVVYAGCGAEGDRRYFGLVTAAETVDADASHSCHVFAVDARLAEHDAHGERAAQLRVVCTRDPVAERCLEFPPSAEYVVGVIRGMYSLPADDYRSPALQPISRLAVRQGDSPAAAVAAGALARCGRAVPRAPRDRAPHRHGGAAAARGLGQLGANSPQPSNHSEVTTTSSNSDSGIGFHNDCRNIADRILVVDFVGQRSPPGGPRVGAPRRPLGLAGCASFDLEGSFLSNTTPLVEGFGGTGLPLDQGDGALAANDLHAARHDRDAYNYNAIYSNVPSGSRSLDLDGIDDCAEERGYLYELIAPRAEAGAERTAEGLERLELGECQSAASMENETVVSGAMSKASADSVSVHSTRSHEEARPRAPGRRDMHASLDDMLVLGTRAPPPPAPGHDHHFLHPATVNIKVRKSKPSLSVVWKSRSLLGRARRARALSGGAGARSSPPPPPLPAAASEPDLRDTQSEQSSPFRRWTTGNGAGSFFRQQEPAAVHHKQMSEGAERGSGGCGGGGAWREGGVARWALGLEHLLADPVGVAAFTHFLDKEFANENIHFWSACERYAAAADPERRAELAASIWETHLSERAPEPVNIDAAARNTTHHMAQQEPPPPDLFRQAQAQIFAIMKFDSYPRFLKSSIHAEYARAELMGLPPPHPPPERPASAASAAAAAGANNTKLKKCSSNASEQQRRGGGLSLLPWRRAGGASRDRGGAPEPSTSRTPEPPRPPAPDAPAGLPRRPYLKDVVTGAVGLCRVVLPDGATSVVGVERVQRVRDVVDRLLARRNLRVPAYDVITIDERQRVTVDLLAPATCMAGREVAAEERAVVRFGVAGRAVGVRCHGHRRLRRVLRVLAGTGLLPGDAAATAVALTPDNRCVHPDVRMRELHGQWLAVRAGGARRQPPPPAAPGAPGAADEDAALADVLVVAHEGQLETDHRFEAIRVPPVEAPPAQCPLHAPPGEPPSTPVASLSESGDDTSLGPEYVWPSTQREGSLEAVVSRAQLHAPPAARVRAALQPGAPLHHHPAGQAERRAAVAAPATPPPPLPPKPVRLPTFV